MAVDPLTQYEVVLPEVEVSLVQVLDYGSSSVLRRSEYEAHCGVELILSREHVAPCSQTLHQTKHACC